LINNGKLKNGLIRKYQKQKAEMVKIDKQTKSNKKKNIIDNYVNTKGDVVRHDSANLALAIEKIIK
jgi:nicotinic acid phosphoribosyltransferase